MVNIFHVYKRFSDKCVTAFHTIIKDGFCKETKALECEISKTYVFSLQTECLFRNVESANVGKVGFYYACLDMMMNTLMPYLAERY